MPSFRHLTATLLVASAVCVQAAPGDQPVKPLAPAASNAPSAAVERAASLPARGLFKGDQLTDLGKRQLTDLILDALGLRIEVALVVPTGPWQLEGSGLDERDMTPARLDAVKRFLSERGIDPQKIYVESRIDNSVKEPRLDLQLLGREATD